MTFLLAVSGGFHTIQLEYRLHCVLGGHECWAGARSQLYTRSIGDRFNATMLEPPHSAAPSDEGRILQIRSLINPEDLQVLRLVPAPIHCAGSGLAPDQA